MTEAVIFDVDGTLVDSVDFHAEAWQRAFERFGKRFDLAHIRSQIGKGGDQLMPVFLSQDELRRFGKEVESYRTDLFQRDYLGRVRGFGSVPDLFRAISARGKRIALASSAKNDELAAYKKAAGIVDAIDVETSSDDAERSKPHPDIFEAALHKLSLAPERAVVVGDSPFDAEAAGRAGVRSIGVLCGGFNGRDILAAGAQRLYRDPRDLLDRLEEWLD